MKKNRVFDNIRSLVRNIENAFRGAGGVSPRRFASLGLESLERRDQPSGFSGVINVDQAHRIQLPIGEVRAQDLIKIHVILSSGDKDDARNLAHRIDSLHGFF